MNVVWLKKDLRSHDHMALTRAIELGPTIALFIFEPEWLHSTEYDCNHLRFVIESLEDLKIQLQKIGIPLLIKIGSAIEVFDEMHRSTSINGIYAHQETGLAWTYERDKKVIYWCRQQGLPFIEFKQFGVIRGLKNRDEWAAQRKKIIERRPLALKGQVLVNSPWRSDDLPYYLLNPSALKSSVQKGGRYQALQYLDSFLSRRGEEYFKNLSSPVRAFEGCSRLSPHLTWGTISLTEVTEAIKQKREALERKPYSASSGWQLSLKQIEDRLWWHCHFIQKLESEPEIEFHNFNRDFDGMRESEFDEAKFKAWCRGETGFPLVDACMRALLHHGWLNFRMRAMLMSFASYQLWLHWKKPAEFLARHFLDFEPGIHYSQAQMQSGVTGINTIRIYSPSKQVADQDPEGLFIRKYVPELANVPNSDLAEPHKMPPLLQIESGFSFGRDYPLPIVDPEESYRIAKQKIFSWKNRQEVKNSSKKVLVKHGSRRGAHFPQQKR